MPEIGTSGSMSGDGKRGAGRWPQATAPILDSTQADIRVGAMNFCAEAKADSIPWRAVPTQRALNRWVDLQATVARERLVRHTISSQA